MSVWFDRIESYYKAGLWTKAQVKAAAAKGAITEEEAKTILGE